jgi:hypothetical protein
MLERYRRVHDTLLSLREPALQGFLKADKGVLMRLSVSYIAGVESVWALGLLTAVKYLLHRAVNSRQGSRN